MSPIKVGIIGAGQIVENVHLPVLLSTKDVFVGWITDANLKKARSVAKAYGVKYYEFPENLSSLPEADIILLAIPFGAREPYYAALKERKIALYVEKPFSRSVEQHKKICSWFPDYRLAVGFQRRSWGPTLFVKRVVEDKLFGELLQVRYGFGGTGIIVGGRYSADSRLAGGGILMESGIHGIDAVLFCTDALSVDIKSASMIMDSGFDLHTEAAMVVTAKTNSCFEYQVTISSLSETINRIEFYFKDVVMWYSLFSEGLINIKPLNGNKTYTLSAGDPMYPVTAYQTFHEHWTRFLNGLRDGCSNWTSASQTLLTTEVIEKLYQSSSGLVQPSETR